MIGYATLGTNDPDRAKAFYDALLSEIGAKRVMELPDARNMVFYGFAMDKPMLAITRPYDGSRATPGNGGMIALALKSREDVDRVHAKAVALGAADEGAPGLRGAAELGYYFAYFRDLDGNKLAVFRIG